MQLTDNKPLIRKFQKEMLNCFFFKFLFSSTVIIKIRDNQLIIQYIMPEL